MVEEQQIHEQENTTQESVTYTGAPMLVKWKPNPLILGGVILLLVASILELYVEFTQQAYYANLAQKLATNTTASLQFGNQIIPKVSILPGLAFLGLSVLLLGFVAKKMVWG